MAVIGLAMPVLMPVLPPFGQRILLLVVSVPILLSLYVLLIAPAGAPDGQPRIKPPWNWMMFVLVTGLLVVGVVAVFMD